MPQFQINTTGTVKLPGRRVKSRLAYEPMTWRDLDAFTQGYIEALFFTVEGDLTYDDIQAAPDGTPPARQAGFSDLASETLASIIDECEAFKAVQIGDLHSWDGVCQVFNESRHAAAGHDFWLTRNGHGAGFGDGDWPEPYASALDAAAKAAGSVDAYLGDDGKVYC